MATFRKPVQIVRPDGSTYPDVISNQITASNQIGNLIAYVLRDVVGSDHGLYVQWNVPKNYVGSPVLVIKGILDGAPGASDVLGFGFQGLALADNEAADSAFSTEDVASATIGSSGTSHSDEDQYVETITLTNLGTLSVDDLVYGFVFLDVSATTYAGNFLLTSVEFEYADA